MKRLLRFLRFLMLGCLVSWEVAFAHGMDKPGPHQGYIRMPGAFHTELVPAGESRLKVFLLDVEFKEPVTSNSSLNGVLKREGKDSNLNCKAEQEFFTCDLPTGLTFKPGDQVVLKAARQGTAGGLAVYKFPLKYANF